MILIACFVLCLFFLVPIRLAFWMEEFFKADQKREKLKYRWSVFFAGVMITGPTLLQLVKSYLL
jgi:cytochrome c biogenesis protein CcdA